MTQLNEDRVRAAMQAMHPTPMPSARLEAKVAALAAAATASPSPQHRRLHPLGLAAVTSIAALAVAGYLFFTPKLALANTMRRVSLNLLRTQGLHYRLTMYARGKAAITREIWQSADQWRQDSEFNGRHLTQIKTGGRFWDYDPATHTAWYQPDQAVEPLGLLVEQLPARVQQALQGAKGVDLGGGVRNGRRIQTVAVPGPVQTSPLAPARLGRTLFRLDLDRMLPAEMEQQVRSPNGWATVLHVQYDLDRPVSLSTFTQPLQGARLLDINAFGAEVGKRFKRPLALQRFATRSIVLRDVQVGKDGDLFVLYTDGSTRVRSLRSSGKLSDDVGTPYAANPGAIEPFMVNQNPENSRGITVDGEIMRGLCAVPLEPKTEAPGPRRIVVEIAFTEYQGTRAYARQARFNVSLPRKSEELLPAYAADLAALSLSGGNADRFKRERERARRAEFRNSGDWAGLIRASDRAVREGITDVSTYLDRADAFQRLGQFPSARQALQQAYLEDESGFSDDQIRKAERKLTVIERNSQ